MKIFNKIYSKIKNETIIAKLSYKLSHKEIMNVCLQERPHYVSSKKALVFLEAIDKKVVTEEKEILSGNISSNNILKSEIQGVKELTYKTNLYHQVKNAINIAKKKNIIVSYEKCRRGKYILIHFPFYNGTMELKGYDKKRYKDIYWWHGTYRDLKVYACGNKKNRMDDVDNIDNSLWDPSGSASALDFFDQIKEYNLYDSYDRINEYENVLFSKLSSAIHNGTMRGYMHRQYQGWYEMLLRCDYVENTEEGMKVFGSPVFVSHQTKPGYGWYVLNENVHTQYYQEWNGEWLEHYYKSEYVMNNSYFEEYKLKRRIPIGFNYGYQISKTDSRIIKHIDRKNIRMSRKDIVKAGVSVNNNERVNIINSIQSVCFTTDKLKNSKKSSIL